MIVRMAKVEIVGRRTCFRRCLPACAASAYFQIEPATVGFIEEGHEDDIRSFMLDEKSVFERMFLEELRTRIGRAAVAAPSRRSGAVTSTRGRSWIPCLRSLSGTVPDHGQDRAKRIAPERAAGTPAICRIFGTLAPLIESVRSAGHCFIGLTIREPDMVSRLKEALSRITDWKYELVTRRQKTALSWDLSRWKKRSRTG